MTSAAQQGAFQLVTNCHRFVAGARWIALLLLVLLMGCARRTGLEERFRVVANDPQVQLCERKNWDGEYCRSMAVEVLQAEVWAYEKDGGRR